MWGGGGGGRGVGRGRHGNRHSASKLQPYKHLYNVNHDISVRQLHACCRCKVNGFTRSEHPTRRYIYRNESLSDTTGVGFFYVVQASFKHFVCALDVTHVQQLYHIPELQQQGHDETGNMYIKSAVMTGLQTWEDKSASACHRCVGASTLLCDSFECWSRAIVYAHMGCCAAAAPSRTCIATE